MDPEQQQTTKTTLRKSGSWNVGMTSTSNERLFAGGRSYEQLDAIDEGAAVECVSEMPAITSVENNEKRGRVDRRVSDSQLRSLDSKIRISKFNNASNNLTLNTSSNLYEKSPDKSGVRTVTIEDESLPVTRSNVNPPDAEPTTRRPSETVLKSILKKSIDRSFSSEDSVFASSPVLKFSSDVPSLRKINPLENVPPQRNALGPSIANVHHRSLHGSLSTKETNSKTYDPLQNQNVDTDRLLYERNDAKKGVSYNEKFYKS